MAGVILTTLLFSLGGNLPGFEQLQAILPLLKVSRGPSTILMVTNIFWIIWLGSLLARDWPKPKLWQKSLVWLGLGVSLSSALAYYLGLTQFEKIWQLATSFLGPKLTQSPFHTLAKDQIIWQQIFKSLAINAGLFAAASWLWQRRWWVGLALVVAGDMLINTAGLYYFAPSEIYFTANQLKQFPAAKFASDWQFRTLIRNGNYPYTDLGAYWEAIAVRPPFSDSYVNAAELENYGYLSRFARGLTPDWNQVVGLSAVNGYVTLLPQSVQQTWAPAASSARINNLPEISLNNPALKTWAVKYYLVDHWFAVSEDLTGLKKIASQDWWDVYELPGVLARVRWLKADQTAEVSNWQENPNQISLSVKSLAHQPEALILADRYDKNWRAWVDDQVVSITNVADQRQILVPPGLHHVKFEFIPFRLYQGAAISGLTLFLALSLLVCLAKRR
jgi:hypothetical protein